jgi:glycosyltransferase involved in cell wall biosynthesis
LYKKELHDILISVIIPVRNRHQELQQCLQGLQNQDCRDQIEVIVIDDASSDDGNKRLAIEYGAKTITLITRHGAAYSRNIGVLQSRGEYLLFLDSDVQFLSNTTLSNMIKIIATHPECGCVGGEAILTEEGFPAFIFGRNINITDATSKCDYFATHGVSSAKLIPFQYLPTSNCLTRKQLVMVLSGFDDAFCDLGSDKDFGFRLHQMGFQSYVNINTVVYHYFSHLNRDGDALYNQYRTQWRFILRHLGIRSAIGVLLKGLIRNKRTTINNIDPLILKFENHLKSNILHLDRKLRIGSLVFSLPSHRVHFARAFLWTLMHLKHIHHHGSMRLKEEFKNNKNAYGTQNELSTN